MKRVFHLFSASILVDGLVILASVYLLTTQYYALAVVPGLLILIMFNLGKYPQFGYYCLVFLVPFSSYRQISDAYRFLTISKLVGILLVGILLFHRFMDKTTSWSLNSRFRATFFGYACIALYSALTSSYFPLPLDELRSLITAFIVFWITIAMVNEDRFLRGLPTVIIASITVCSILSIIGYVFSIELFAMDVNMDESVKRGIGAENNPNHFAAMIIFCLPLVIHRLAASNGVKQATIYSFVLALNILSVILTYSRGGALVLSIVLLFSTLHYITRIKPVYLGFAMLLMTISFVFLYTFIPASYWERQMSITQTQDRSVSRRVTYLYVGLESFRQSPWFGIGPGMFDKKYAESLYSAQFSKGRGEERDAHNTYIEVIVGTGIFGFLAYVLMIALALKNYYDAIRTFKKLEMHSLVQVTTGYCFSFFSLLLYFFLMSSFSHKYFWISLGVSQIALWISQEKEKSKASEDASCLRNVSLPFPSSA